MKKKSERSLNKRIGLLANEDLDARSFELRHQASNETSQQRKNEALKRLQVIEAFRDAKKCTELEAYAHEEWAKIPKERCKKLVSEYKRRLKQVITAKGCFTKY